MYGSNKEIKDIISQNKCAIIVMAFAIIGTSVLGLGYPYLTGKMIDALRVLKPFNHIMKYALLFLVFFMMHQMFRMCGTLVFVKLTIRVTFQIKKLVFERLSYAHFETLQQFDKADIVRRLEEDTQAFLNDIYYTKIYKYSDYVEFVMILVMIAWINPVYLMITVSLFPLYMYLNKKTEFILKGIEKRFVASENGLLAWLTEFAQVSDSLRNLGAVAFVLERTCQRNQRYFAVKREKTNSEWKRFSLVSVVSILLRMLYLGASCLLCHIRYVTLGEFIAVFAYMESAIHLFEDLHAQSSLAGQFGAEKDRIQTLLTLKQDVMNHKLRRLHQLAQYELVLEQITVVKDTVITTHFTSGELNVLCGESGSGKTTLLMILSGLLEYKGKLFFNQCLIDSNLLGQYRQYMSYANQQDYFFDGTLRFNLTYGNTTILESDIVTLLQKLNLLARVQCLPYGLDEPMENIKRHFSGGELRRLVIVRTFLKKAPIVLLDEVTAGLDKETQEIVLDFMKEQAKCKLVILVTHERDIIAKAKRLYRLNQGQLVCEGLR